MKSTKKQIILFETQIYQARILSSQNMLYKHLIHDVLKVRKKDIEGIKWSQKAYVNGYTSYGSLNQIHYLTQSFQALADKIQKHVSRYLRFLNFDLRVSDLYLSRMWINIMPKNCYHAWHIHPLSVISGTFYLQIPKKEKAPIVFEDPRMSLFMNRPSIKGSKDPNFFSINPQEGDLILFESWLRHTVPMHQGNEERISISFNFDWKL